MAKKKIDKTFLKKEINRIIKAIEVIEIQGATNVAKSTVALLGLYVQTFKEEASPGFILSNLENFMIKIGQLRRTEPLARNGIKYVKFHLQGKTFKDDKSLIKEVIQRSDEFIKLLESHKEKIQKNGAKLIKANQNIFTHCHSSMVEGILIEAYKKNKFRVFNDETRPLLQGHITSKNLRKAGVPNTIVVDGVSPYLISRYSGQELMMDQVFLGTDSIALDGGCVNKIGSYGITLSAYYEKIPVYIATSLLKLDLTYDKAELIKIEERAATEIWEDPPRGLKVINLAFDLIPSKFIKAYITEFGLVEAKNIRRLAKEKYPWLFVN